MVFNGVGAVLSAIVFLIAGVTKFAAGAWVSILVVVAVVVGGSRIRRHYAIVHRALALHPVADELPRLTAAPHAGNGRPVPPPTARDAETEERPEAIRHLAIVLARTIDLAGTRALAYAASLGQPVLAVHLSATQGGGRPLPRLLDGLGRSPAARARRLPYRALLSLLVHHIEALHRQRPDLTLTVILPEIVVRARSTAYCTGGPRRGSGARSSSTQDRRHHRASPPAGLDGAAHRDVAGTLVRLARMLGHSSQTFGHSSKKGLCFGMLDG